MNYQIKFLIASQRRETRASQAKAKSWLDANTRLLLFQRGCLQAENAFISKLKAQLDPFLLPPPFPFSKAKYQTPHSHILPQSINIMNINQPTSLTCQLDTFKITTHIHIIQEKSTTPPSGFFQPRLPKPNPASLPLPFPPPLLSPKNQRNPA